MHHENNGKQVSNDCFVLMPIADPDGYEKGHFKKVYDDIFKVACEKAGLNPVRADDVKETNLIHLDILQKLIESPMAICDLSSRNPNVLFELGLRQAFDKPTVIVQEVGTPRIFDISPMRYTEYRKELKYREVLEDQKFIAEALMETQKATSNGKGVNSLIQLLSLTNPAKLKEGSGDDTTKMLQVVMAEMNDLRADFRNVLFDLKSTSEKIDNNSPDAVVIQMDILFNHCMKRYKKLDEAIKMKIDPALVKNDLAAFRSLSHQLLTNKLPAQMLSRINHLNFESEEKYAKYIADIEAEKLQ